MSTDDNKPLHQQYCIIAQHSSLLGDRDPTVEETLIEGWIMNSITGKLQVMDKYEQNMCLDKQINKRS